MHLPKDTSTRFHHFNDFPGRPREKEEIKMQNLKLTLVFNTEGNRTIQMSLDSPQENLTAETIQAHAAMIFPILQTSNGLNAVSLKSAEYVTTSVTKVV